MFEFQTLKWKHIEDDWNHKHSSLIGIHGLRNAQSIDSQTECHMTCSMAGGVSKNEPIQMTNSELVISNSSKWSQDFHGKGWWWNDW